MSDLIEQLRRQEVSNYLPADELCSAAADEIEHLQASLESCREGSAIFSRIHDRHVEKIERLQAKVEKLERFRSAALAYEDSGEWTDYETYAAALKAATEQEGET